jgi:hypothetical protein
MLDDKIIENLKESMESHDKRNAFGKIFIEGIQQLQKPEAIQENFTVEDKSQT